MRIWRVYLGAANNNSSYYSYCFDQRFSCFFWRPRTRHFCTRTTYHRKIPTAMQLHENSQQAVMSFNRRYVAENSRVRDAIPSVLNVQLDGSTFLSGAPRNSVVLFCGIMTNLHMTLKSDTVRVSLFWVKKIAGHFIASGLAEWKIGSWTTFSTSHFENIVNIPPPQICEET